MSLKGIHFFLKPVDTPLEGVKVVGWVRDKVSIERFKFEIEDTIIAKYNGGYGNLKCYPRLVEKDELNEPDVNGNTCLWHRDYYDIMVVTVLEGPGTEFCAANIKRDLNSPIGYEYYKNLKGKKYNFPNNYLLLVDNTKVAHRTPPWLRQDRWIYRWSIEGKSSER